MFAAAQDEPRAGGSYRPPNRLRSLPTWLTNQAALRAYQLSSSALSAAGSHTRDYALLASVVEHGPASQAELGRRTGIDASDVVAALGAMEARGDVRRERDRSDRRRSVVMATRQGRRRLQRLDVAVEVAQAAYLEGLSEAERRTLVALLERVAQLPPRDIDGGTSHP
jgi:MarR family transcriptional regulator, lower aerobic nicotinate degradation pathway regulator